MTQPSVVPFVEGQAEVDSVPLILRRLLEREERYDITIARPIRFKRSKIRKRDELARTLAIGERDRSGAAGFLLLLDADDDCPVKLANELRQRARAVTRVPFEAVVACREFEAWFLGSIESLRGAGKVRQDAVAPVAPEQIRDAKGKLSELMPPGRTYHEAGDQPAFARLIDLDQATTSCRSFRHLRDAFQRLLEGI